jgi:hypothetical protein
MVEAEIRWRFEALEQRLRWARAGLATLGLMCGGLVVTAMLPRASSDRSSAVQDVVRAHRIIVVDEAGTERILLGPAPGQRRSPQVGIMINDAKGHERFGVGIADDGLMGMGFDAPVGVGDQRKRERLYIAARPDGTASLHVMDNNTRLKARLTTDREGNAWLEFLDWGERGVDSTMRFGLPQAQRLGQKAVYR